VAVGCAHKRDARQFAAEIRGVALAILGMVQDGVDVMEDVPFGDGRIAVVRAEFFERPVGDVLAAVGAVFGVGVEEKIPSCCGSVTESHRRHANVPSRGPNRT
jgi:hypothetical protein